MENNVVLYRKYRPQGFDEIIGQSHIVQTLTNSIKSGSISHAYLFCGPRGSGKTTIARIFAKAINCQSPKNSEPCNKCDSCLEIMASKSLDLIEIDAASHTGVEEVRELISGIKFSPVKSKYKIFIIDECLTQDHLISMADGRVKKISEIKNGDKVLSVDTNNGSVVEGTVSNWFERKTAHLIELKTPQTYLKVTPSHKLWVLRGGDFFLLEAKDLKLNDFLLSPVVLPHAPSNSLTPEYLSFLALIQCDGHVSKDSITVQVEVSKDKDYFQKVFEDGLIAWGIKEKPVITTTSRKTRLMRVYSKKLKEDLVKLGCPQGKRGSKIDIPDTVFQSPLASIKYYLDTCFCCEGNVDFDKKRNLYRLHFTSTSEIFSEKLQILLKKFGIASSYNKVHKERKNKNHSVQHRITLSHNDVITFHKKIGLSLSRKNELLRRCSLEKFRGDTIPIMNLMINRREEEEISFSRLVSAGVWLDKNKNPTRTALTNFIKVSTLPTLNKYLNFRYEKIKKIQSLKVKEKVYDFTVEGTHTFIVNGICSSNCHQLSKPAANALLKTLEEPPAHAIFMLATTEAHKMIPTIISRCQRFDFKRLHTSEIIKKLEFILKKEGVKFEPAVLPLIALNARGSFRDAESLLDKCINFTVPAAGEARQGRQDKLITLAEIKDLLGIVEIGQISKFVDFLILKQAKEGIEYINAMADEGVDLQEFAKTLVFYLRQCLMFKINPALLTIENSGLSTEELSKIKEQTEKLPEKEIQTMLELFIDAENKMKYATILQLPLELAAVDLTHQSG